MTDSSDVSADSRFLIGWNFLFILEMCLVLGGLIRLDLLLNLLLVFYILIPAPRTLRHIRMFRYVRGTLSLTLAIAVLWKQSWLPDASHLLGLLREYGLPSTDYMISFVLGAFSMSAIIVALAALALSIALSRRRLATFVVLPFLLLVTPFLASVLEDTDDGYSLGAIPAAEAVESMDPNRYLEAFYSAESEKIVSFKTPQGSATPFDVVILHVCSLSWDDLKEIGIGADAPFFKQFDYLFTNFNSATGYSGPAMRRLFRASCGQKTHAEVHRNDTPKDCLLFDGLASVGYQPYISMTHDGVYGDFLETIKDSIPADASLLPLDGFESQAIFFDGKTKLYSDYEVLKAWLDARQSSPDKRAALYHNSVLLHAGVRWKGEKTSRGRDAHDQFADVSSVLLEDIQAFIDALQASKRNTVLLFVPEHGRALVGSPLQPADVRDIPLPRITKVPVGVKLIGEKFKGVPAQNIVSKPTSYFALSWLLARFMEASPFDDNAPAADMLSFRIPRTEFVAEQEGRVVMEMEGRYWYRDNKGQWTQLGARQLR